MENKLLELTKKIYSEGIEKSKTDAELIVLEAQKNAEDIIRKAQLEASEIIKKAEHNSEEIKRNTESEVKMASKQAISRLKQQVVELITAGAIEKPVKEAMKDKEFIGSLILKVASCFNTDVQLILPEADKKQMESFFSDRIKSELNKGVTLNFDSSMNSGFKISPENDSYIISFTDEDFAGYFKGFMRPKTIKLLFGEE